MKKLVTFVTLAALLAPLSASATTQIIVGRTAGVDTATNTNLVPNRVTNPATQTATSTAGVFAVSGTIYGLNAWVSSAPGGSASWTVTVENNTTLTSVTCTITSAVNTCADLVNTTPVIGGQNFTVLFTANNSPAAAAKYFSFKFSPTTDNQTVQLFTTAGTNLSSIAENYTPLATALATSSTESGQTVLDPEAGSYSNLQIGLNSTPSPGSYVYTIRNFSANATSTVTCTTTSALKTCADTTHTYATSSPAAGVVGDLVDVAEQPASAPTPVNVGGGVAFTPNTYGDYDYIAAFNTDSATGERYIPIVGQSNPNATFASTSMRVDGSILNDLQIKLQTAPGGVATRQFGYIVNGATSTATCTITGTATGCRITSDVQVYLGDLVSIFDFPSGSPAPTKGMTAIVTNVPPIPRIILNAQMFINSQFLIN